MSALTHRHPPAGLLRRKGEQIERFLRLRHEFADRYSAVAGLALERWILPEWEERNEPLERDLLPLPGLNFLAHRSIRFSMLVGHRYLEPELPAVLDLVGDDGLALLEEDPVGEPPLAGVDGVATSANLVHHAHHLARLRRAVGAGPQQLDVVVEWGGGYGSLARLHRRLHGRAPTWVVIDTPLFSCLQWLYLASVFGPDAVELAAGPVRPRPGRITLVPVPFVEQLHIDRRPDLFVSTWALNESSWHAQDHVVARRWFGAEHLLLAVHEGVDVTDRAVADGARVERIGDWMPGQTYVLR